MSRMSRGGNAYKYCLANCKFVMKVKTEDGSYFEKKGRVGKVYRTYPEYEDVSSIRKSQFLLLEEMEGTGHVKRRLCKPNKRRPTKRAQKGLAPCDIDKAFAISE